MLAKVIKKQSAAALQPFFAPQLNVPAERQLIVNESSAAVGDFVFPKLESIESIPQKNGYDEPPVLSASAENVLQNAREESERIIAQAEQQSEMMREAIREKAMLEARQVLEAEYEGQIEELRGQLSRTIEEVSSVSENIVNRIETEAVELALEIAKKVVGREVMFDREIALTLVKVSLKKLHNRRALAQVHLHPEDYAYVQANRAKLDSHGSLEIIEDAWISLGGCLIHTETGDVDARIESQFEEISRGLLGR